jgi:hypothetical protein
MDIHQIRHSPVPGSNMRSVAPSKEFSAGSPRGMNVSKLPSPPSIGRISLIASNSTQSVQAGSGMSAIFRLWMRYRPRAKSNSCRPSVFARAISEPFSCGWAHPGGKS